MTTGFPPYKTRNRAPFSGRERQENPPERIRGMIDRADRLVTEPLRGVTADGSLVPGLFPLQATGVSTEPVREAALAFLATLSDEQRLEVMFAVDDSEQWRRWNNTHMWLMRHGFGLEHASDAQREAALGLLRAAMSASGFQLARDIMRLNHTIGEITGSWEEYGEWLYWISIFGDPASDGPWGFQYDGHHCNINVLIVGDQLTMSPVFMGSEPTVAEGGIYEGIRVLEAEETNGLSLAESLTGEQRSKAVLLDSIMPDDIPEGRFHGGDGLLEGGAWQDNLVLPYEGIRADALSAGQQDLLMQLVETYVGRMRDGHSEVRMEEVRRHLDETHFLWLGGIGEDAVFYYRVHSPVIMIEFDHQRGVALEIDHPTRLHIHTVVRTPNGNDYGADLLRQHYERHHGK